MSVVVCSNSKTSCTSIREGSLISQKVKFNFYSRNYTWSVSRKQLSLTPSVLGCSAHQRRDPPVRQPYS